MKNKYKTDIGNDILLDSKTDRRILSHVPDPENIRSGIDRRYFTYQSENAKKKKKYLKNEQPGTRYSCEFDIKILCHNGCKVQWIYGKSVDISTSGIMVSFKDKKSIELLRKSYMNIIRFRVTPGAMPEGYEIKVKQRVLYIRDNIEDNKNKQPETNDDITTTDMKNIENDNNSNNSECSDSNDNYIYQCALKFATPLYDYARKKRGKYVVATASLMLFFITAFVIFLRTESIIYFRFNKITYLYSIIAAVFLLSRYFFGSLYKEQKIDMKFTPGVTVIIPCFNEETWIQRTIHSCVNQDYPIDKLEVIVVDDCSNDKSVDKIVEFIKRLNEESDKYDIKHRVSYAVQETNKGKRDAMARGVKLAKHDLVVFVDSDSFLDPNAIRNIVQPFKDSKMGGVSGRTDVANTYTNALTKMQSVRYFIAFRIMKAAESYFDAVTCLSGPLSCYKKSIVLDNMDAWLNQRFLGQRATFGDDRSMTNFILKNHRTCYQDSAICHTIVPNDYKVFLKQQMRWKRSWLRESIIAAKFMWRKEPFMALFFYIGVLVPILAPVVVIYNLFIVPFLYNVFPTTFIVGILLMSMMMSSTQLFLRKSSTWLFGMFFCFYYEVVLLWQMPIAWVTFWKTTWGTRMTPEDIKEQNKKTQKRMQRKSKA